MRTNSLYATSAMALTLCGKIRSMGQFLCCKSTQPNLFSVNLDRSNPAALLGAYTKFSRLVVMLCLTAILLVLSLSSFAQVTQTVVMLDTVDVVYLGLRPVSVHTEPSKPVGKILPAKNLYSAVSTRVGVTRDIASTDVSTFRWFLKPNKFPSSRVVRNQRPDFIPANQFGVFHISHFLLSG